MKPSLQDYFIPHKNNDYTPHLLQRVAMLMMLGLVILTFTAANLQSLLWFTSDWLVSTILPGVIVDLTNDERDDLNVSPLVRSVTLDTAAQLKAEHMAENSYFAHYSPQGVSPWYWFSQVEYKYVHAGENLAIHFSDSGEVVDAWMESPSHRANIVNGNYREIGVGTARGTYEGFDTVYVVQLFGTKAARVAVSSPDTESIVVTKSTEVEEESIVLAQETTVTEVPKEEKMIAESFVEPVVLEEQARESLSVTEETVTSVEEMEVTNDMVSVYSGTIATTVPGIPASIEGTTDVSEKQSSAFGELLTQPSIFLQIAYSLIGFLVLVVLLLSIVIEIKHQRPMHIAYGFGLLTVMSGLFYLHSMVTAGAVIL